MLNIITALPAEAAPIIAGLSLKPLPSSEGYSIFCGHGIRLGISGMGCANASILTNCFLMQGNPTYQHKRAYWLNFGIAGSAGWEIGELVLAHSITEQSTGKTWTLDYDTYCDINLNLPTAQICTVDMPQTNYQGNNVYDMEAAGIVSSLCDSNVFDDVFFLKMISDGANRPLESLTKHDIKQMLNDRAEYILAAIENIYGASLERVPDHNPLSIISTT